MGTVNDAEFQEAVAAGASKAQGEREDSGQPAGTT